MILPVGHSQVVHTNAVTHPAEVIQLQASGHWAMHRLVGNDVLQAQYAIHSLLRIAVIIEVADRKKTGGIHSLRTHIFCWWVRK